MYQSRPSTAIQSRGLDLGALLAEAGTQFAPLAAQRGIRVQQEISGLAVALRCDRDRVLQVFSNLIGNAIKFTPEGGEITLRAEGAASEATMTVSDTGRGIPAEQQPHIFDRYWTGRGKAGADSGLGLFIAKGIVEAHGGKIWVSSTPERGSSFSFTLPTSTAPGATGRGASRSLSVG